MLYVEWVRIANLLPGRSDLQGYKLLWIYVARWYEDMHRDGYFRQNSPPKKLVHNAWHEDLHLKTDIQREWSLKSGKKDHRHEQNVYPPNSNKTLKQILWYNMRKKCAIYTIINSSFIFIIHMLISNCWISQKS